MLVRKIVIGAALGLVACCCGSLRAADSPLIEMEGDVATKFGGLIAEQFKSAVKDPQLKFDADADRAVGLFNAESHEGIIAVPAKGWKEDPQNKEVEKEGGAPLCLLFLSPRFNPLVDGKPIDPKKLRVVKIKGGEGKEREATCLICSVKHEGGDDWQLYVYGAGKDPVLKTAWGESPDAPKGELTLKVKDANDGKASLVLSIFGKYDTSVPIGHKLD